MSARTLSRYLAPDRLQSLHEGRTLSEWGDGVVLVAVLQALTVRSARLLVLEDAHWHDRGRRPVTTIDAQARPGTGGKWPHSI